MFNTPTPGLNINSMEGCICPKCGYEKKLFVDINIRMIVHDDGTDLPICPHEYDETTRTECPQCGFIGPHALFEGAKPEYRYHYGDLGSKWAIVSFGDNFEEGEWLSASLARQASEYKINELLERNPVLKERLLKLLEKKIAPGATPCPTCGHIHALCSQCERNWTQCSEDEPGEAFAWCEECNARHVQST